MVLVAAIEGAASPTFLHATYRLHTVINRDFMGETNLAGAGLM